MIQINGIELTPAQEARVARLMISMGFKTGTSQQKGGTVIGGEIDKSVWICPQCDYHIMQLEYEHLSKDGCCINCGIPLVQYKPVDQL